MIKVINCKNKNYKNKLKIFLDRRRSGKIIDTSIVSKIIKDIKKNHNFEITLLFSKNRFITLSTEIVDVTLEDQNLKDDKIN